VSFDGRNALLYTSLFSNFQIKKSWIKLNAAIIDVRTNTNDDPNRKSGYRLV
jgi:hypothetical protein